MIYKDFFFAFLQLYLHVQMVEDDGFVGAPLEAGVVGDGECVGRGRRGFLHALRVQLFQPEEVVDALQGNVGLDEAGDHHGQDAHGKPEDFEVGQGDEGRHLLQLDRAQGKDL